MPLEITRPGAGAHVEPGESRDRPRSAESLRLLIVAGGTGGHIFPALAVAEELIRRRRSAGMPEVCFQFLGTARGLETRLIEGSGFPYRPLKAAGLQGIGGWRRVKNAAMLPRTFFEAAGALRSFRPQVVMGMGGYVAGPVLLEAALAGIPTLIVEPNALPGFTNRALSRFVTLAATGFEETARNFGSKGRFAGLPVRRAFFAIPPRDHRPPFTILAFGGSQGAAALNRCLVESLPLMAARPLQFVHQTGEREADSVRVAYAKAGVPAEVHAFIGDMPAMFARADLVISRAGASTVGELLAAGKAAVLVPFPGAADGHQLTNARALERAGAARLIEQSELTPGRLMREIDDLVASPAAIVRLVRMEQAARNLARPEATARIADLIEGLAAHQEV